MKHILYPKKLYPCFYQGYLWGLYKKVVGEEGTLYNFSILHTLQRPTRKAVKGELLGLRGVHSKKWFFLHSTTDTQCRLRNPSCLKTRRRLEETGSQESCSRVQIIDSSNYLDLTLPFLSLKSSKVLGKISPRAAYTICLNSMVITCLHMLVLRKTALDWIVWLCFNFIVLWKLAFERPEILSKKPEYFGIY